MGANDVGNPNAPTPILVRFSPSNPLSGWTTGLSAAGAPPPPGSQPLMRFDLDRSTRPIDLSVGLPLPTDIDVLTPDAFADFRKMEDSPHGPAHVWNGGSLGDITVAVQDPLFFLLHCNVDRQWAQWQRLGNAAAPRFGNGIAAYAPQNPATFPAQNAEFHIGHYLQDTMWPWNGAVGNDGGGLSDRPSSRAGGPFPVAAGLAPGIAAPRPVDALDYLGRLNPVNKMGFSYDDDQFVIQ